MGFKSTVEITRGDAVKEILAQLPSSTDEQIADILETLIGDDNLSNYRIVGQTPPTPISDVLPYATYHSLACMSRKNGGLYLTPEITRLAFDMNVQPIDFNNWWDSILAADAPIR